jgi:hypothetical protein
MLGEGLATPQCRETAFYEMLHRSSDLDKWFGKSLEWKTMKRLGKCELDSSGSGYGPVAVSCEHGNEPSSSIRGGEFFNS